MSREFELLNRLRSRLQVERPEIVRGIGDDAAVVSLDGPLAISKDLLIEGCHFEREWISPWLLGCKALRVNLSDLAAMAAQPLACLLGLGLPQPATVEFFEPFADGFISQCSAFNCPLIGGDLAASSRIIVSVTVLGRPLNGKGRGRAGGKAGDRVAVVGPLGESGLGLELLRSRTFPGLKQVAGREALQRLAAPPERQWLRAHFLPEPQLEAAAWLETRCLARSMMDLSDGLAPDLLKLSRAAGLKAVLEAETLRAEPVWGEDPTRLDIMLFGGEDYSLLFTVGREDEARLRAEYPEDLPPCRIVGSLEAGDPGLWLRDGSDLKPVPEGGFEHFS